LAGLLMTRFDAHVLDTAYLAAEGYILLSDDMYYRQVAEAAAGAAPGVWFQPVLTFAREEGLLLIERYADLIVQLAWRRHNHLALDSMTLARILIDDETDGLVHFKTVGYFIGTKSADIKSHVVVVREFLTALWGDMTISDIRKRAATGILLECLVRHQTTQWSFILAFIRAFGSFDLQDYMSGWIPGHFLSEENVSTQQRLIQAEMLSKLQSGHRR